MVRVVNLPPGKTVEGLQPGGTLAKKISLTVSGNKNALDALTANDLEVVVDAANAGNEMVINIDKKNLVSVNPELDIGTSISKVSGASIVLRPTRLVTEKIPIIVTNPIGEAPRGYQFIDIFPYRLFITVSGPEKAVKRLKDREIRLTFNLNDISRSQLDSLAAKSDQNRDEVSFTVPDAWKQISIPSLSDAPLIIDDPDAKFMRIDFIRRDLIPLDKPIPVTVFYPPDLLNSLNPSTLALVPGGVLEQSHGVYLIQRPLAVKGVSRLFLDVVKDNIEIIVTAESMRELGSLSWSLQFIDPKKLEDFYLERLKSEPGEEEGTDLQHDLREDYLRNRFRNYMTKMQLFHPDDTRFDIKAISHGNSIQIQEVPPSK